MPIKQGYTTKATQPSQDGLWDVTHTTNAAPAVSNIGVHPAKRRISEPTINPKSPRLTNGALGKSRIANDINRNCADTIGKPGVAIAPAAPIHPGHKVFPEHKNATSAGSSTGLPKVNASYRPTAPYGIVQKENAN